MSIAFVAFSSIAQWNKFLLNEIKEKKIQPGVLKPVQHYLTHVPYMIEKQGVLKAYSGRSMERTIGRYKKLIKSKVDAGANAGNVLDRFALYGYVNSLNMNLKESLNLLAPKAYTTDTFISLLSDDPSADQLWSPLLKQRLSTLPCNVSNLQFVNALQKFYQRVFSSTGNFSVLHNSTVSIAGRAWSNGFVYTSTLYKLHIKESRRGNNYIMFAASHLK